ncbi:MAG: phytanoyl-CoA dioxygenase family protein [Alphaproteobacteria bacterium]|nr:phytanoyl-CoA dioxygenase family protein [Alphaproteobacteria bacterium]
MIREQLGSDGFAIVRGVLSPDEVREVAAGFDHLLAIARGGGDPGTAQFVMDADPFRVHRVVWCGGADARLAALGDDPRFLALAAEALQSRDLVQIIQQAHFKLPGDGVGFGWHQDASNRRYGTDQWTDVDGRGSFVELAMAVDPMTPGNGPLRMIPGTHRLGFVADPETGAVPESLVDADRAVDVRLEPGDVAVFGPFVIHGSTENTGDSPRRLFLQGYALPGANRRVYPGCGTGVPRRA